MNVRTAEGGLGSSVPPPETQAQRLRIVMSHMKRYLCPGALPLDINSVFCCMLRYSFSLSGERVAHNVFKGVITMEKVLIRVRMGAEDAHYGGNLVDGAHMLHLFGDVATELLIRSDGDEGLFCAYDNVEFLAPVYAGDFIEAVGEITHMGNTSRKMTFEARKVIAPRPDLSDSACDVLSEPVVVCRASGTCVVPKDKQRGPQG